MVGLLLSSVLKPLPSSTSSEVTRRASHMALLLAQVSSGSCKQAFCAWFKLSLEGKRCKTTAQKKKEKFFVCFWQGVEGELGLLSFATLTPLERFTSLKNGWNPNSAQFIPPSVFPPNLDWRQLVLVWAVCYIRNAWVVKDRLGLWVAVIICNRHPTNCRELGPGYRPTYGFLGIDL